ncbi:hypothetical protein ABEB36_005262 [Hypothenemus hampei]|uniref:Uncharacterized protein n=1 Tax=Hypothenemus hampei TaxID=57062 RepID=A0ABD1EXL3_HYPHA
MTIVPSVAMNVNHGLDNALINQNNPKFGYNVLHLDGTHYNPYFDVNRHSPIWNQDSKKDREKRSVGLSVLTLLSFLFFLHILQSCIQEQSADMQPPAPQVIVMQAKAKSEEDIGSNEAKNAMEKIDETTIETTTKKVYFIRKTTT